MRKPTSCFVQHLLVLMISVGSLMLSGCGESEEAGTVGNDDTKAAVVGAAAPGLANVTGGDGQGGSMQGDTGGEDSDYGGGDENYEDGDAMSESGSGPGMDMSVPGRGGRGGQRGGGGGGSGSDMAGEYGNQGANYQAQYNGGNSGSGRSSSGRMQNGAPALDVSQWTKKEFVEAVKKQDRNILTAIAVQSEAKVGDPQFAGLMKDVLAESTGTSTGGAATGAKGVPGFPAGLEPGGSGRGSGQLVPPGGAALDGVQRLLQPTSESALDSLEAMLGESTLAFVPQAAQGTRGAAGRLQGQASGGGSSRRPPISGMGMGPSGEQSGMNDGMNDGMSGGMDDEYDMEGEGEFGMDGEYGNNGGYPNQGGYGRGQQNGGYQIQAGLTQLELVQAIVAALVQNNSGDSWNTLLGVTDGSLSTGLSLDQTLPLVLREVFSSPRINSEMAEQILEVAVNKVLESPAEAPQSLALITELSKKPVDHYFGFAVASSSPPPSQIASGQNSNSGAMSGMSGMGSGSSMNSGSNMGMGSPPAIGSAAGRGGPNSAPGRPGSPQGMGAGGGGSSAGMGTDSGAGSSMGMGAPGLPGGMGAGGEMMGGGGEGDYGSGFGGGGYGSSNMGQRGTQPVPTTLNVSLEGVLIVAKVLWSKQTAERIIAAMASGDSGIMTLAAGIPSDPIRQAIFEKFSSQYSAGTEGTLAKMPIGFLEPGMLAVLKGLPRLRPARANADPDPTRAPRESWVGGTKQVVLALRERLRVAASNPKLAYTGTPKIRLHRGAVAEQSIAIVVPNEATAELGDAAPSATKIYYTKSTLTPQSAGQQETLAKHYEKYSKGFRRVDMASQMLWFDGVVRNTDGTRQSIDIIIQKDGAATGRNNGFGQPSGDYGGGEEMGMAGIGPPGGGFSPPGGPGAPGGGGGGSSVGGTFSIEVILVVTRDPQDPIPDAALTSAAVN